MRTSEQIITEIEEKFGFVPPFFKPAQPNPQVLENLWQQTLLAYVNNPLSLRFKAKLSAYLSRYCAVPYCIICHACTLYSLGVEAREVLALLESPPPKEIEIDQYLSVLKHSPSLLLSSPEVPVPTALEASLLNCTIYTVLETGEQAKCCQHELLRLLGLVNYQHLITFVAWVKTCNAWMEAYPEVSYAADKRVQKHLTALLAEEPALADFFSNYRRKVRGERQSMEEALRLSEEKFFKAFRSSPDSITISTLIEGRYVEVNDGCLRMSGYRRSEMIGRTVEELQIWEDPSVRKQIVHQLQKTGYVRDLECHLRIKSGAVRIALLSGEVIEFEGQTCLLAVGRDITDRKASEEQLFHTAFYDSLTGLGNRALFMDRLRLALANYKRNPHKFFAVLFLDLDRFKVINDSLGHTIGDQLLIAIAGRLATCLRPIDLAARLGGDEFTILLVQIQDITDVIGVAERIQDQLRLPFALSGHEVYITASIGIALNGGPHRAEDASQIEPIDYPDNTDHQPEDLLRNADIAMYHAKGLGKARYEIFNPGMYARAVNRLQLETEIRRAVVSAASPANKRQEFQIYYQPIVLLENASISGFEALIRWRHPERGLLAPVDFLPVAEEIGLSSPIDQWVLHEACQQVQQWQEQFPGKQPLSISVNLGDKQFTQVNLSEQISQTLQETRLDASSLKLEITENVIMEDGSATTTLLQLKALGIQLAIDDFGTGYSSLARLHRFPIDTLKVDRSFISRIGSDQESLEFIKGIMALAHYLKVEVTAEGIETPEQFQHLKTLNCKYGQGYFFAPPLAAAEVEALFNAQP